MVFQEKERDHKDAGSRDVSPSGRGWDGPSLLMGVRAQAVWVRGPQGWSGVWSVSGVDPEGALQVAGRKGNPSGLSIPIRGMALDLCAAFTKTGETGQRQVGGVYPHGLCDDGQGHGFWDWPHTPGDVWPWAKALYLFVPLCSCLKNQG